MLVVLAGVFECFIVEVFRLCLTLDVFFRFRFSGTIFRIVGIMGDSRLFILEFRDSFEEVLCSLNSLIKSGLENSILFHHAFGNGVCLFNDFGFNFFYIDMGVCFRHHKQCWGNAIELREFFEVVDFNMSLSVFETAVFRL